MKNKDYGWAKPLNTLKYHYFENNKSLCSNLGYVGDNFYLDSVSILPHFSMRCKSCTKKFYALSTNNSYSPFEDDINYHHSIC